MERNAEGAIGPEPHPNFIEVFLALPSVTATGGGGSGGGCRLGVADAADAARVEGSNTPGDYRTVARDQCSRPAARFVPGTGRDESVQNRTPFGWDPVWTFPRVTSGRGGGGSRPIAQSGSSNPVDKHDVTLIPHDGGISAAPPS